MKESPELFHGVLEGCAGDEDLVVGVELDQGLVQQRLVVLQPIARQCYYDNQQYEHNDFDAGKMR